MITVPFSFFCGCAPAIVRVFCRVILIERAEMIRRVIELLGAIILRHGVYSRFLT